MAVVVWLPLRLLLWPLRSCAGAATVVAGLAAVESPPGVPMTVAETALYTHCFRRRGSPPRRMSRKRMYAMQKEPTTYACVWDRRPDPNCGQRPYHSDPTKLWCDHSRARRAVAGMGVREAVCDGASVGRHSRARRARGRPRHTSPRPVGCGAVRGAACSLRASITRRARGRRLTVAMPCHYA